MSTQFSWLVDAPIVGLYLLAAMTAGLAVRKYVGNVETFLVAGREVKVYLGIASLAATEFGIVTGMYTAQLGYKYGFSGAIPGIAQWIAMMLIGLTGFCITPLRASGAITVPELFEKRFGQRIRWAAGVVIVLGGLLNMGVFLRVGGEFLVLAAGFNYDYLKIVMTIMLIGVAAYTILGGMLSVLITDFLQFIVMSIGLLSVTYLIFFQLGWSEIVGAVETNYGAEGFNPFIHPDLGWQYVVFQMCLQTAATLTWQTTIARVLAAKDVKTGRQIYTRTSFFFVARFMIPALWGMAALAVLTTADMEALPPDLQEDPSLYAMPLFLGKFVPIGLSGLLIAAMLAADMSTDSSYMLTWASVIYNDIMAPFRKGAWSEKRGLRWNRAIVACIGVFLLIYGLWYPMKGDLWTYLGVTGTVYLASMSTLLIACCYWKQANDWGAAGAIIMGAAFPIGFLILEQVPATQQFAARIGPYYSGIAAYAAAWIAMVGGSLLKIAIKGDS